MFGKFQEKIERQRLKKFSEVEDPSLCRFAEAVRSVQHLRARHVDLSQSAIEIGSADELSGEDAQTLSEALKAFVPWKKGPFRIYGTEIDAEWRSDWKWDRIAPHISPLKERRVADIGCHNGYFMFRMAASEPKLVVGFEPVPRHYLNFQLLQGLAQVPALQFEMLGVEHVHWYPEFFDTMFCLGILYHHTDPVGLLRKMRGSLRKGGELVVDCQGIPGEESLALVPSGRYANASGVWFLPTLNALKNWLRRAQFRDIECFYAEPLSTEEQRSTVWAPIPSLKDFLDPRDPRRTIEGYPAPWRFYVRAVR